MENHNINPDLNHSNSLCELDSTNQNIDCNVLQETGLNSMDAEWSATSSAMNILDTSTSYSYNNIEALKEHCANPSDTLKNKDDFMVIESTSTNENSSNYNADNTKYLTTHKTTAFQKKHKPLSHNVSHMFENILNDESQLEITQNNIRLSRFQKRKRLLPPMEDNFVELDKSDSNIENSFNSPKLGFSKNINRSCINIPDYNLSNTDSIVINDQTYISKTKESIEFKKPSDTSLVNDSFNKNIDTSKTNALTHKFTRKILDMGNSAFDNIINDSSIRSDITSSNECTSLNNSAVSNINGISMCSTLEMPSLNHTYDIPVNGNSTRIVIDKTNHELINNSVEQPINEMHSLENDSMSSKSNNVSLDLINTKKILSETYTIENNLIDTSTQLKSANKLTSSLSDMSNIYNQSKSSVRKPNFIRKLQLNEVSPNYNICNNFTVNEELNEAEKNKSKRFEIKKTFQDADSMIFDNIIATSQENEASENINISNNKIPKIMNACTETIIKDIENINDLLNVSPDSKFKKNVEESMAESLTQQSNVLLEEVVENDKIETSLLHKYNTPSSLYRSSSKFNFSKQFGRHSISYQENTTNLDVFKLHSISLNTTLNKTQGEKNNIYHKSSNSVKYDSQSHILETQENQTNSQKLLKLNVSLPCESKILSQEVEKFKLSQSLSPHFTGIHNINAHSGVFSDLINNSLNSDTSLTLNNKTSKQIKFQNHTNKSKFNSIIFDNVITNSQESNSTSIKNKSLNDSVLCNHSIVQRDEINMFVNTDDLYNSESIKKSVNSSKKQENCEIGNIEESNSSDDEFDIFKNTNDTNLKNSNDESFKQKNILNVSVDNEKSYCKDLTITNASITDTQCDQDNITNITAGLLDNFDSPNICSKKSSLLTHNNTLHTLVSNKILDKNNCSIVPADVELNNMSTSKISNNERLKINYTSALGSVRSLKNQSKELLTSRHSTSSTSYDEGLTLFNSTIGLLEINGSSRNQSKCSSSDEELTFANTTNNEILKQNNSSINQSKRSISEYSPNSRSSSNMTTDSSLSEAKDNTNNVSTVCVESLEQSELPINDSKTVTSEYCLNNSRGLSNMSTNLLILETEDHANNVSTVSTRSSNKKHELIMLNNTMETLEQKDLPINHSKRSTSKYSQNNSKGLSNISINSSILEAEDNANNVSRISTRSSKHNKQFSEDVLPVISNIDHELILSDTTAGSTKQNKSKRSSLNNSRKLSNNSLISNEDTNSISKKYTPSIQETNSFTRIGQQFSNIDGLTKNEDVMPLNTTIGSLEKDKLLINHSKRSSKYSRGLSSNSLILEDNMNNLKRMSTRLLKQNKHSFGKAEPSTSNISNNFKNKIKLISTSITKSTDSIKKSLSNKTLRNNTTLNLRSNKMNTSTSSHCSKALKNVSVENESDNSNCWTTLSENYISKSTIQNVIEFETPKNNTLAVVKYIANTIGIMSLNKEKVTHPGAFELEDLTDGPLTRRSSIIHYNHSPSILTRAFALNNTSETINTSQFLDKTIDIPQVEEIVKEKFTSLYNKESWITKGLYKFLINKLLPQYNIYSAKYAEKFIKYLVSTLKQNHKNKVDRQLYTDMLRYHMARYGIITNTFDYIGFLTDYIPRPYYDELIPGWDLETSDVKFNSLKAYVPIMEDEEFLNYILEILHAA